MADYNSSYTGLQIDDAVGKALAALPADTALSITSEKAVQNKAIYAGIIKAFPTATASGAVASFPDGADNLPVKKLVIHIKPAQDGSGDPSPTNVRPISGWTGCNIAHSGADTSDPTVVSISWQSEAGTVYGGTLDVTSGVLTVTHAKRTLTASGVTFNDRIPTQNRVWFTQNDKAIYIQSDDPLTMCETAIVSPEKYTAFNPDWFCIGIGSGNQETYIGGVTYLPGVTDLSTFKTWLNNNPITYTYKLKTPQVYQLTPQEINTLLGQNNIWADCGDVSVEYCADPTLYINGKLTALASMITNIETGMAASKAYAVNDFLTVNNQLYIVTAPIANGGIITPGTNVTETTIGAQITGIINT